MDYENFKEQFVEDVKERLYEQGTEVDITVNTVNKLNESYEAVAVKPDGSSIGIWRNQCRSVNFQRKVPSMSNSSIVR